jgi:hypothetical protein
MVQIIQATNINLYELERKFGLQLSEDEQFFREWVDDLPELTELEKQQLDRVKASYFNLAKRPMLESIVKMVVLSPLLDMAGLYLSPFSITAEEEVQISAEDDGTIIRGRIDVLVVQNQLWILIIESKRAGFSLEEVIPQALAYMLANPELNQPTFGMVTNGSHFIFIKLVKQDTPQSALSSEFSLRRPGNELYSVLSILKRLTQLLGA